MSRARALVALAVLGAGCADGPNDDGTTRGATDGPWFEEVSAEAGLVVPQADPNTCVLAPILNDVGECYLETWTGGAAVGDIDADGDDDLFLTRIGAGGLMYRNLGDGTFEEVAAEVGIDHEESTNGAAFADIDNDGDLDLFVTGLGTRRHFLYVNDGTGRFTEEAERRGAGTLGPGYHLGTSPAFGDFDRDGFVDLYVPHQVPPREAQLNGPAEPGHLLRNRGVVGPGEFEDATSLLGLDESELPAFAPSWVDLDGDGLLDLEIVSNDGTSRMYWNEGDGRLVDGTAASGVGDSHAEMGSTFGDYDGDGDLDWFVTGAQCPIEDCETNREWDYANANRLYRYDGDRRFTDVTMEAGVRVAYLGWGTAFLDPENDGDLDIVATNGWVNADTFRYEPHFYARDPMRFWRNDGELPFVEASADYGLANTDNGHGLLLFDYDDDGDQDLLVVNAGATPSLFRNRRGNANDWLRIRFTADSGGFEGLGAVVRVTRARGETPMVAQIGASTHYLGQSERVAHFGLGAPDDAPVHEVSITWPSSGATQVANDIPRNQTLVVVAPAEVVGR